MKESDNIRESEILINEIDTLDSVLGRLMDLKYGKKTKAIEISEANQDFGDQLDYENRLIKSKIRKTGSV